MAINKNAYTRYLLIDECIRNSKYDKVTVAFLRKFIQESKGIEVSERTIKGDIENMRINPQILAPIESNKKNGYFYSNPSFSLSGLKLTEDELQKLKDAVDILIQISGLNLGKELDQILKKIKTSSDNSFKEIVLLDQSDLNKGGRHINLLIQAIKSKQACEFHYIKHNQPESTIIKKRIVSPLGLKEHSKTWYLIGLDKASNDIRIFALDRIENLDFNNEKYLKPKGFALKEYFKHSFGISVQNDKKPDKILLRIKPPCLEYIMNFPWHWSQKIEEHKENEIIISFQVHESHELVKEILGWGLSIEVLAPSSLRKRVLSELEKALENYEKHTN